MADRTVIERLFSAVPDIVFCMKNRDRVYVAANEAFAERLGLGSRWDVVGRRAEDFFPPSLAAHYRAQDEEVMATGGSFRDRMELVPRGPGELGWHLATKVAVKDAGDAVIGLASISRDLQTVSGQNRGYQGLSKVIRSIEERYAEKLDRGTLAAMADLSETQLERRMKRIFGLSVAGFQRKVRIENAARMLAESAQPLAEVALACGYGEQSTFTRQFKAVVGITPGHYRKDYHGWWG